MEIYRLIYDEINKKIYKINNIELVIALLCSAEKVNWEKTTFYVPLTPVYFVPKIEKEVRNRLRQRNLYRLSCIRSLEKYVKVSCMSTFIDIKSRHCM